MPDKRIELIKLLIERTATGALKWEEHEHNAVKTNIGPSTIILDSATRFDDEIDILVTVVNGNKIVENFSDIDLYNIDQQTYYPEMKSLLSAARRSASGADQVLSDIISALKENGGLPEF